MLYHGMQLLWTTKVQFPPVVISVAQFGIASGLLVSLGENGTLDISYLGTKPPSDLIHGYERKDLQYDEMDEEHRKLLRLIGSQHLKPNQNQTMLYIFAFRCRQASTPQEALEPVMLIWMISRHSPCSVPFLQGCWKPR